VLVALVQKLDRLDQQYHFLFRYLIVEWDSHNRNSAYEIQGLPRHSFHYHTLDNVLLVGSFVDLADTAVAAVARTLLVEVVLTELVASQVLVVVSPTYEQTILHYSSKGPFS
jgi:hypothetical protein